MTNYNDDFSVIYNSDSFNEFSIKVFINFIDYCKKEKLSFKKHIDLACGTGVFCLAMKKLGVSTKGVDISSGMITEAKKNAIKNNVDIPFMEGNMVTYQDDNKYDLVTCNYDAINHLLEFEEWVSFFKNVYIILEEEKYFLFDFNTFENYNKLCKMDPISEDSEDFIFFREVNSVNEYQLIFNFKFKIKNSNGSSKIINQTIEESFFKNVDVLKALEECGFSIICIYGKGFECCSELSEEQKLHILCKKVKNN